MSIIKAIECLQNLIKRAGNPDLHIYVGNESLGEVYLKHRKQIIGRVGCHGGLYILHEI